MNKIVKNKIRFNKIKIQYRKKFYKNKIVLTFKKKYRKKQIINDELYII